VRNLADTVIEVDREGNVLYINRSPRNGETTQMVGQKVYDCIAEEHHGRVRDALRTVFTPGNEVSYEARAQSGKHGATWHEARLGPVREEGDIVGATIVARDITAVKRAEEERTRSENKFRNLVESMTDVVWEVDREGRFTYCTSNVERVLGYTVEEMEGKSLVQFLPGRDGIPLSEGEAPSTFLLTQQIRTKDGLQRTLEVSGSPVGTGSGGFQGYRGSIRDITDRAEVERSLRRTLEQIDILLKQRQVLLWTTDRDLRFTSLIGCGIAQGGFTRNDMIGKSLFEHFRREDPDFPPIAAHRKSMEGKICQYEVTWEGRTYQCRVEPHSDADDTIVGTIGVALDVTEFKAAEDGLRRSEEQLRQSQKMEAIGRLAGGVAHDFNNLLTAITGYSDIILQQIQEDEDLRADVGEIKKAADRASALTRQLLAFSRKQVLRPRTLDMNEVIRDMEKMLRRVIGEDIALDTILSETPAMIQADPGQIEQVVVNLAVNAREAMDEGGRLTLATENVDLADPTRVGTETLPPGRYLRLSTTDTGRGMDEATLQSCFEPFFTTKEMGTGMGLSTVYGVVKQSGGAISVTSDPSRGTRVEILFAREEDPAASSPLKEVEEDPRGGTETILLVEDEEAVRILVEKVLRKQGYDVLVARHAGEALVLSEKHPASIDLLLSDVVMPQMSGPELAQRLVPLRPEMRVLFMSGYTDDFLATTGALDQGTGFIQKPFKPAEVVRKVREVLEADVPVADPALAL
jgi:PAS domain S-box-containing protein